MARIRIAPNDPVSWDHLTPCAIGHHLVYRIFDASGRLLYVGITWTPRERWRRHRKRADWWPSVAAAAIECHPSEQDALRAELAAIKAENPIHNKRGVAA